MHDNTRPEEIFIEVSSDPRRIEQLLDQQATYLHHHIAPHTYEVRHRQFQRMGIAEEEQQGFGLPRKLPFNWGKIVAITSTYNTFVVNRWGMDMSFYLAILAGLLPGYVMKHYSPHLKTIAEAGVLEIGDHIARCALAEGQGTKDSPLDYICAEYMVCCTEGPLVRETPDGLRQVTGREKELFLWEQFRDRLDYNVSTIMRPR